MLELTSVAAVPVAVSATIHASGTVYWLRSLVRRYAGHDGIFSSHLALPTVTSTAVVLMLPHALQVLLWAFAYRLFLPGDDLETFERAAYSSFVTFTTLGYGDIRLVAHEWRLPSRIEALVGILLAGWTTAFLLAVVQRSWKNILHGNGRD